MKIPTCIIFGQYDWVRKIRCATAGSVRGPTVRKGVTQDGLVFETAIWFNMRRPRFRETDTPDVLEEISIRRSGARLPEG